MNNVLAFQQPTSLIPDTQVLPHQSHSKYPNPDTGVVPQNLVNPKPKLRIVGKDDIIDNSAQRISIEELYPASEAIKPELNVALRLLSVSSTCIQEAIELLHIGDSVASDDAIQRLQAILPELFCCRIISDSFGAMINATYHALKNQEGLPLTKHQIQAIGRAVSRIRSEPFMRFEAAVEEIMALEEVGFIVEPPEFEYLADWLDE